MKQLLSVGMKVSGTCGILSITSLEISGISTLAPSACSTAVSNCGLPAANIASDRKTQRGDSPDEVFILMNLDPEM